MLPSLKEVCGVDQDDRDLVWNAWSLCPFAGSKEEVHWAGLCFFDPATLPHARKSL